MTTMISDAGAIQQTLLEWSHAAKLREAVVSEDGAAISLLLAVGNNNTTVSCLDAATKLTVVASDGRSCEYTAAAIFLQIRDPAQALLAYRNDCKRYNVPDFIKAFDKAVVVSHFVRDDSQYSATATAAATAAALAETSNEPLAAAAAADAKEGAPPPEASTATDADAAAAAAAHAASRKKHKDKEREKRKHHESSSSRHKSSSSDHHRHRSSSTDHHHHHHHRSSGGSSSRQHAASKEQPSPKKKKPDMVTNEQLFEHLNVVVDKRSGHADMADAITTALSAKGFEITNGQEQLDPYRERTARILANEIPVGNSASILRANNPRKDLTRVLELYMEATVGNSKDGSKTKAGVGTTPSSGHKPGGTSATTSKHQAAGNAKQGNTFKPYLVGKKPVIVVPKGMTAPITLINAHEFLCNARFVPRDAMMKQQQLKGLRAPPTTFTRTIKTGQVSTGLLEYEIIDNPRKLGHDPKEWDRIVAVLVLGQGWQFKDWLNQPAYNVPATLFDRVYGFFVNMEGDKVPADVAGWAVHRAQVNRDKRGLDSVTYASFWNGLDEWMRVYKAELLPQSDS